MSCSIRAFIFAIATRLSSAPHQDGGRGFCRGVGLVHTRALCTDPCGVLEVRGTGVGWAWSPHQVASCPRSCACCVTCGDLGHSSS